MPIITIYGLECSIPEQPSQFKIDGAKLSVKKQKFRRVDWEKELEDLEYDEQENPLYTEKHIKFIEREIDRCKEGYWFMNKGEATYLTGKAYYYYTYWILENSIQPEFRESDRLFFIFFDTCLRSSKIKGIIRIKNRRLGATSIGACIETHIATFNANKKCGNVSKKDTDARKLFQDMIVFGFYHLPMFLRPRVDTSSTSKNELHFIEPARKGKAAKGRKIEGLNSKIDFEPTSVGAYDSTRLSFVIVDEGGKWEKVNILSYFDVVIECVSEGAKKKGFIYMPSTVNEPKKGGTNFQSLWDDSNQFQYGLTETPTGMIRFFQPSYECLAGFFDEYGRCVVDPPDEETLKFLIRAQLNEPDESERIDTDDLKKGARKYLLDNLNRLTDDERKDAFKRKYPLTETDSFSFGSTTSPFNTTKIQHQLDSLNEHPEPLRRGNLFWDDRKEAVDFSDDRHGHWLIYKPPTIKNSFTVSEQRGLKFASPDNSHTYKGGVDTYRFDVTAELGSNGVICIGTSYDSTDEDGGIISAMYVGRPKLTEMFWRECLLAACYFGAKLNFEKDATQEYKKYFNNTMPNFLNANCNGFLLRKPDAAIDDSRKVNRKMNNDFGVSSADKFIFAKEIELGQVYIEKDCHNIPFPELLQELLIFDVDKRTKFDRSIAFMVWLLAITGEVKARKSESGRSPIVQTYAVSY